MMLLTVTVGRDMHTDGWGEKVSVAKYYWLVDLREGYLVVTVLFSKQKDVQLTGAALVGGSACPACAPLLLALPVPAGHVYRPTSWAFSPCSVVHCGPHQFLSLQKDPLTALFKIASTQAPRKASFLSP